MNSNPISSQGFCYVLNHKDYLAEAWLSIESLRRTMPEMPIAVVCPENLFCNHSAVNHWIELKDLRKSPIIKIGAILAPFERVAFVDTDTMFCEDMSGVFELLQTFDLALAHEPTRGYDYDTPAPRAFCEMNTGLIVFRNDYKVRSFFNTWSEEYDRMLAGQNLRNDQPAFRTALWNSPHLRLATLPSEYHCITRNALSLAWGAKFLHGRGALPAISREINRELDCRAYIPGWGQLRPFYGRRKWIQSYLQLTQNFFEVLLFKSNRISNSRASPVRWDKE